MKGGIQKNTTAYDADSKELDKLCRKARNFVKIELALKYPKLKFYPKLKKEQIPGNTGGCCPDGGVWFYDEKLILTFEGKKQQNNGNAVERWFKNNYICRKINPNVSYLTFASGSGAIPDGVIWKILSVAHSGGANKYCPGENSLFLSPDGFTLDQIVTIVKQALQERIENEQKS